MSTIVTRSGKGSPLTNTEVDANFTNLNTGKAELSGATFTGDVASTGFSGDITGAVLFQAKAGEGLTKGDPVYISGISGNQTVVSKADANDANKMPCFGIVDATVSINANCSIVTFGTLADLNTSAFSEGDELYVSDTGTLSATAPTGEASQLQKIAKVTRSHASAGSIKVMGAGRTNATPNLDDGKFFLGNSSNQSASATFSTSVTGIALPLSGGVMSGAITTNSTFDGRDVATDGTKLDGIEASATADQTGAQIKTAYEAQTNAFTDAQFTKLGGIEASADVTDATNVTAAGALMDSELTSIASVKALNQGVATGDSPTFVAVTGTLSTAAQPNVTSLGTIASLVATTADINGGTIDGTVIGGTTPAAISGTTGQFGTSLNVDGTATMDGLTVDGVGSFSSTAPYIDLFETDTTDLNSRIISNSSSLRFQTVGDSGSGASNRLLIDHATGDISFYEDTGTTPKFFWDASAESLGIGTSSPSQLLELSGATAPAIRLTDTTYDQYAEISTANAGSLILKADVGNGGTGSTYIGFEVDGANEAMRIDASGNVGIGTNSPSSKLEVAGSTNSTYLTVGGDDSSNGRGLTFTSSASASFNGAVHTIDAPSSQGVIALSTYATERARITSDGHLLVGSSSASASSSTGVRAYAGGNIFATASGTYAGYFNRLGSDGEVIKILKNGTTVGSIGTTSSNINIGNGDTRLRFYDGAGAESIFPILENGNNSNGVVDLGVSTRRFKNLYLSGGVQLGGTGAANRLDDFETGTWTPALSATGYTFAYTRQEGIYTKIGNMVSVKFFIRPSAVPSGSGTVSTAITGLPFTPANVYSNYGAGSILMEGSGAFFSGVPAIRSNANSTNMSLYNLVAGGSATSTFNCALLTSATEFEISLVYHTA